MTSTVNDLVRTDSRGIQHDKIMRGKTVDAVRFHNTEILLTNVNFYIFI